MNKRVETQMKNAVICHGATRNAHSSKEFLSSKFDPNKYWKEWLVWELAKMDICAQLPTFPRNQVDAMKYSEWAEIMDMQKIGPDTILIGHSAGGGFLLKYLAENPQIKVKQLILVAPWIDPDGFCVHKFYDFVLDKELQMRVEKMDLFYSTDDAEYIIKSCRIIENTYLKMDVHKFSDRGHFHDAQLPEVLEIIE